MFIDFNYFNEVREQLRKAHEEDASAYDAGRHVYRVEFIPEEDTVSIHVQWPTIRWQISDMIDCGIPVDLIVEEGEGLDVAGTLFLKLTVDGITLHACVFKSDLEHLCKLHKIPYSKHDSSLVLFDRWKKRMGWEF